MAPRGTGRYIAICDYSICYIVVERVGKGSWKCLVRDECPPAHPGQHHPPRGSPQTPAQLWDTTLSLPFKITGGSLSSPLPSAWQESQGVFAHPHCCLVLTCFEQPISAPVHCLCHPLATCSSGSVVVPKEGAQCSAACRLPHGWPSPCHCLPLRAQLGSACAALAVPATQNVIP